MEIGKRYKIIAFFLSLSLSLFGELGVKHLPSHHDNTGCPPLPSHLPARLGFRTRYLTASLLICLSLSLPLLSFSPSLLSSPQGKGWLGQQGEDRCILGSVGRALALRAFGSGPPSQLSHLLPLWPGTDLTTLNFCFLTCKMGIIIFRATICSLGGVVLLQLQGVMCT